MHWSRVKTILIIMFLFVDIVLFSATVALMGGRDKIDSDTISKTVTILEENGIHIKEKLISHKIPSLGTVETENLRADRDSFARLLLDDKTAVFKSEAYKSGKKKVTFDGAKVRGENLIKNIEPFTPDNIKNELELIGINAKKVIKQTKTEIVLMQEFGGKPVFETEITVTPDNVVSGYFLTGNSGENFSENEAVRLLPVCSALINLIDCPDASGQTIESIETGYTLGDPAGNDTYTRVSVFPAYRIKTQSGKIFMFDALSGDLLYAK